MALTQALVEEIGRAGSLDTLTLTDVCLSMVKTNDVEFPEERDKLVKLNSLLLSRFGFSKTFIKKIEFLSCSSYAIIRRDIINRLYQKAFKDDEGLVGDQLLQGWLDLVRIEACDYVERVKELCLVFGIELSDAEIELETFKYCIICFFGSVIDQWKYTSNLIFLNHFKFDPQDVPLEEKPYFLGLSLLPRRMKVKLNRMKSKGLDQMLYHQKVYTIFQGFKKGLLPVQPEKVVNNLLDHAEVLSRDQGQITDGMRDGIERTVFELFKDKVKLPARVKSNMSVSSKSTIENNFQNAGALGKLLHKVHPWGSNLDHQFYGYISWGPAWHQIVEVKGPWISGEQIFDSAQSDIISSLYEKPFSKPACILEPMKVRIITKPKWNQYLGMKDIQKTWWSRLVRVKCFELIGRPISQQDILDLERRSAPNTCWVSGDYSAATDNLKMDVTLTILKAMFKGTDLETYFMCRNALTGGSIIYDLVKTIPACRFKELYSSWSNEKGTFMHEILELPCFKSRIEELEKPCGPLTGKFHIDQRNGQLMGSIISFLLLCIANLSAYRHSIETYNGCQISLDMLLEHYPVLINGDDILFKCDRDFYHHWKEIITAYGFKPSPGKNLFHKNICQINSVLYRCFDDVIDEVPYVNFGLMTNRRKQECEIDASVRGTLEEENMRTLFGRVAQLKKIQSELLDKLHERLQPIANRIFIKHQAWLKDCFPGMNIFFGEQSGGLGLNDVGIDEVVETSREARIRRTLCAFTQGTGKTISSFLFPKDKTGTAAIIAETMGNTFPSLRLGLDESEEDRSPINLFWKAVKLGKRLQRGAKVSQGTRVPIDIVLNVEQTEKIWSGLPIERMDRFNMTVSEVRLNEARESFLKEYGTYSRTAAGIYRYTGRGCREFRQTLKTIHDIEVPKEVLFCDQTYHLYQEYETGGLGNFKRIVIDLDNNNNRYI